MKILVIVHQFLPTASAGTEVYTYKLAKGLQARGHELCVFHTERNAVDPQFSMRKDEYDGLPVYSVVHNHQFEDFRRTYKDVRMEEHLRTVLAEFQPDVVHIQHIHLHSIDYIGMIKERGIPVVYTLAEYLNICPRNGFLAKLDFSLCDGPVPAECAVCAAGVWPPPGELDPAPREAPASALASSAASAPAPRYSLARFLGKLRVKLGGAPPPAPAPPPPTATAAPDDPYLGAVELRWREHKAALDQVDLFIAPSRFLREQFIRAGMIDAERIVYSDYGFDHAPFADTPARGATSGKLRVGFIGAIAEQKGVHHLVEAFNGISPDVAECVIYGGVEAFPEYVARMEAQRKNDSVKFLGRYRPDELADVLQQMDVAVVPSIWFENSPLSIHEAFMSGLPVITGDRGGMAELVEHEVSGLHYRMNDAEDLRKQIQRLVDEPELLARMRTRIPAVKTMDEDAAEMEARFLEVVGQELPAG